MVVIVTVIAAGTVGSGSRRCMSADGAVTPPLASDVAGDARKINRLNGVFAGTLRSELRAPTS